MYRIAALVGAFGCALGAAAQEPGRAPDRVESVQHRAWQKRGSFSVEPFGAYALNDPFLIRGGGGVRATYWPRSLLGFTAEAGGLWQSPSEAAVIAQRELRARIRPTGSGWFALAGAEVAPADGKLAFGSRIVPFELLLRGSLGAASATEDLRGTPVMALGGALGVRWFLSGVFGLETMLSVRSASLLREVDGRQVSSRDTIVGLELGMPVHVGGGR